MTEQEYRQALDTELWKAAAAAGVPLFAQRLGSEGVSMWSEEDLSAMDEIQHIVEGWPWSHAPVDLATVREQLADRIACVKDKRLRAIDQAKLSEQIVFIEERKTLGT